MPQLVSLLTINKAWPKLKLTWGRKIFWDGWEKDNDEDKLMMED
jgi:hypothetical protein